MNFLDRLQFAALPFIDLMDGEADHYHGCGPALVAVENGHITASLYVAETITTAELERGETTRIFKEIITPWVAEQGIGEIYMGKMSCHQMCEPEPYSVMRAARLGRWIIEEYLE